MDSDQVESYQDRLQDNQDLIVIIMLKEICIPGIDIGMTFISDREYPWHIQILTSNDLQMTIIKGMTLYEIVLEAYKMLISTFQNEEK